MAKIFLSYDRDDTERARPVALALEKAGHSVWWDLHIRGGEQYTKVIDEALKAADAVVVLWSKYSVESAWVRDEAAAGRDTGRLVPVALDDIDPPLGFRQFQTIDLSRWKGRGKPAELKTLLSDVAAMSRSTSSEPGAPPVMAPSRIAPIPRFGKWPILAILAVTIAAAAVAGWLLWRPSSAVPSVAIEASEQSAPSRSLAHDLFVKLGSLQASNAEAVMLVRAGTNDKPTLIFQVGGDAAAAAPHANLVLLNGEDRSLFWSKEFAAPAGQGADLRQQIGFTAARIIGCAVEALTAKGQRLRQSTVKLYLNACASLAETTGVESEPVAVQFRQVTKEAPLFEGGWKGLVMAQTEVFRVGGQEKAARVQLEKDIAGARKVNPDLTEAIQAEIDLLPFNAFARRQALADRAVALEPNNPYSYAIRSGVFMNIGRMDAAVEDTQRAVQLDPLSPPLRDYHIQTLLYSGREELALQELAKAQRLWPGATNLKLVRFRIHFRYGDAREALHAIRTDPSIGWTGAESYLEARIDPSPAKVKRAIEDAHRIYRRYPGAIGHLAQVYGEFGRTRELVEILMQAPTADVAIVTDAIFRPAVEGLWHDPRSLIVAKRVGLLQFWQSSGKWPDFCSNKDLPYDCKKEAARLLA